MVRGLNKFKEYFTGFEDNYIIIGGTACDILEEGSGQIPRGTKDIDIILVIEALTREFVKAGNYMQRERGKGKSEYFRFLKPGTLDFPKQIEIFSRKPDMFEVTESNYLTPIPVDEDLSSLSAILMNDEYYDFTIEHSNINDNIHLAKVESLICLKAKAYLELNERKQKGGQVDENDIRKHKNDIFRLVTMLSESDVFSLPEGIKGDMLIFCTQVKDSLPDKNFFKAIGIPGLNPADVYKRLCDLARNEE